MLKKSLTNRVNGLSSSAKWTFVFAFLAVISMVVLGLGGESFATVFDPAPPTFTADPHVPTNNITRGMITIPNLTANNRTLRVYCLEVDVSFCHDNVYTQGSQNNDYGLNFILRHGYHEVADATPAQQDQIWITQMAIWYYLDRDRMLSVEMPAGSGEFPYSEAVLAESRAQRPDLWAEIDRLVSAARAATRPTSNLEITWDNANFTLSTDGRYLVSGLMNVSGTPNEIFEYFSISLNGAPSGTVVLNDRMEVMENITELAPGTRFYIRVPVDNITAGSATFTAEITGRFYQFRAWNYTAGANCQSVVLVERVPELLSREVEVTVRFAPDVPDTNLFANRGVLAMGIIILLSGAGIIYANVKPKTQEQ